MPDEYAVLLDWLLGRRGLSFADIKGVSLSSTVPAMVPIIKEVVANYFKLDCPLVEVRASGNTGVTIAIENPSEMGADRIVDALAAAELYRVPARRPTVAN
jgi:type III pantothenate kinase